jgi:hypothetical protein
MWVVQDLYTSDDTIYFIPPDAEIDEMEFGEWRKSNWPNFQRKLFEDKREAEKWMRAANRQASKEHQNNWAYNTRHGIMKKNFEVYETDNRHRHD